MGASRMRNLQAWLLLALAGCGADGATGKSDEKHGTALPDPALDAGAGATDDGPRCKATRAQFDKVRPLLMQWCGMCHGASPAYGAPFSLLDYDTVLGPYQDSHVIDRMAEVLASGAMPPAEQPQPDQAARYALH